MSQTIIYPVFFRYQADGMYVFDASKRAFAETLKLVQDKMDMGYKTTIPISDEEILNLEEAILSYKVDFRGGKFAPAFFNDLLRHINIVKQLKDFVARGDDEIASLCEIVSKDGPIPNKHIDDEFVIYERKEAKRLHRLAMKHRLVWRDGLNTIELTDAKISGTDFKCVICYAEFSLEEGAKKHWPKQLRDYPTCSEPCAITLCVRAEESIKRIDTNVRNTIENRISKIRNDILKAVPKVAECLDLIYEECSTCQKLEYRSDIGAYKKWFKTVGTNPELYEGRCPQCLGRFLNKKDRKEDLFVWSTKHHAKNEKRWARKRKRSEAISWFFGGIGRLIKFTIKAAVTLLLVGASLSASLYLLNLIVG